IATFSPTSALVSVLLPALGRPTTATNPDLIGGSGPGARGSGFVVPGADFGMATTPAWWLTKRGGRRSTALSAPFCGWIPAPQNSARSFPPSPGYRNVPELGEDEPRHRGVIAILDI